MLENKIQIRFADVDMFRHVNNVSLQHYYDLGTHEYFREVLGMHDITGEHTLVKVHMSTNFMHPIHMDDEIVVRTRTSRIGNRSVTLSQEIVDMRSGLVKSDAETILAGFNSFTEESAEIPVEYKEAIALHEEIKF